MMREEGMRPCLSLSLSLSTGSSTIFCLLRVCPEGPWGDREIMARDLKEPWAREVTATEEVPLRKPTRI